MTPPDAEWWALVAVVALVTEGIVAYVQDGPFVGWWDRQLERHAPDVPGWLKLGTCFECASWWASVPLTAVVVGNGWWALAAWAVAWRLSVLVHTLRWKLAGD